MNACCKGWSWSPSAKPSIVVTSAPSSRTASVRHEFTRCPSTRTVQAPQAPALQPFFEPVRPKCSRSRSSNEVRLSTVTVRWLPFTVRDTRLEGDVSTAAASSGSRRYVPPITPPATTAPPTAPVVAMKVRRLGAGEDSPAPAGGGTADSGTSVDMGKPSHRGRITPRTAARQEAGPSSPQDLDDRADHNRGRSCRQSGITSDTRGRETFLPPSFSSPRPSLEEVSAAWVSLGKQAGDRLPRTRPTPRLDADARPDRQDPPLGTQETRASAVLRRRAALAHRPSPLAPPARPIALDVITHAINRLHALTQEPDTHPAPAPKRRHHTNTEPPSAHRRGLMNDRG